jgi:hypothetical protein
MRVIAYNPADGVAPPRPVQQEMLYLTPDEARYFLTLIEDEPLGPLYALAMTTGMRLGELLGLRWQAIKRQRPRGARCADSGRRLVEPERAQDAQEPAPHRSVDDGAPSAVGLLPYPLGFRKGPIKRSGSAVVAESRGMRHSRRGSEHEFVVGGRHWTRTSDLLHVKQVL